jgi:predicted RNase H-like HicB family nuclease
MLKKVYPAIFETDPVGYGIYFPDIEGASTQGKDVAEGLEMASDALGIMLADLVERGQVLPEPTPMHEVKVEKKTQFVTLVAVDLADYLEMNAPVKKTLQIPKWADMQAKKIGLNFSQTLTEAILEKTAK